MNQNVLKTFSVKLGITSQRVLRKAQEYHRLIEVKTSSTALAALKITGSCEVVMCLDLASEHCGEHLDKKNLVRLSGLNKRTYLSSVKALESLLGLETAQTLKEMAVQYGCTEATSLAEEILRRYVAVQNEKSCQEMDFRSPLFLSAALCAACRKLKVRVEWSKLRDVASVKRTTYERLLVDMGNIAQDITGDKKSPNRKRGKSFYEELEQAVLEEEAVPVKQVRDTENNDPKVNFQLWKQKILAQAAKKQSS
ncbi:origin recognition complex subunit 6-like [Liolophura sinensis]|uniref:origin recognition complex subunit 6-like n=1 Tax=Liolophura sinensis TaxID=3198878 RepID=UPI00315968B4